MQPSAKQSFTAAPNQHWPDAVRTLQWHLYSRDIEPLRDDLARYCRYLASDSQVAEDLLQETLLRGFNVVGSLWKGLDQPLAYLKKTARNLWIDRSRRPEQRHEVGTPDVVAEPATEMPEMTLDNQLQLLLDTLTPTEYRVFVLQQLYGYTGPEIAELTGASLAAVKMAASRAKRRLAAYLRS